jgi:hypothetical protein
MTTVVYFDIETTFGGRYLARITQLACASHTNAYCSYNVVDNGADGKLTFTFRQAFLGMLRFLRDCRRQSPNQLIVLVGHNSYNFDFPILYREILQLQPRELFDPHLLFDRMNIRFADSLPTMRRIGKMRNYVDCRLETLHQLVLNEPAKHMHNAVHDSLSLCRIVDQLHVEHEIIDAAGGFSMFAPRRRQRIGTERDLMGSRKQLINCFGDSTVVRRLANSGYTLAQLTKLYSGENRVALVNALLLEMDDTMSTYDRAVFIKSLHELVNLLAVQQQQQH